MLRIEQFTGMASRHDPNEVGSRYSRNVTFGPQSSWIETRPGTEHLTLAPQPGGDGDGSSEDIVYEMVDDRFGTVLVIAGQGPDGGTPIAAGITRVAVSPLAAGASPGAPVPPLWLLVPSAYVNTDADPDLYGDEVTRFDVVNETGLQWAEIAPYYTHAEPYRQRASAQILCRDPYGYYWFAVNEGWLSGLTKGESGGHFNVAIRRATLAGLEAPIATIDLASGNDNSLQGGAFSVPLRRESGCYILKVQYVSSKSTGIAKLHKVTPEGGLVALPDTSMTWGTGVGQYNNPQGLAWTDGNGAGSEANLVFLATRNVSGTNKWHVCLIRPGTGQNQSPYPQQLNIPGIDPGNSPCYAAGPVLVPGDSPANAYHYAVLNCDGVAKVVRWQSDAGGINNPELLIDGDDINPGSDPTESFVPATGAVTMAVAENGNILTGVFNGETGWSYYISLLDDGVYTTTEVSLSISFTDAAASSGPADYDYSSPFVFVMTDGKVKFAIPGSYYDDASGEDMPALEVIDAETGVIDGVVRRVQTGPAYNSGGCSAAQYHGMRCDSAGYETYLALKAGGVI